MAGKSGRETLLLKNLSPKEIQWLTSISSRPVSDLYIKLISGSFKIICNPFTNEHNSHLKTEMLEYTAQELA